MRLVTSYAPPTFTRPCIIISTQVRFSDQGECLNNETAITLIETLNGEYALYKLEEIYDKEQWKILKKHKSKKNAMKFHFKLAKQLCRGYKKHFEVYNKLRHIFNKIGEEL